MVGNKCCLEYNDDQYHGSVSYKWDSLELGLLIVPFPPSSCQRCDLNVPHSLKLSFEGVLFTVARSIPRLSLLRLCFAIFTEHPYVRL